jgi:Amt family ammonium transporter
MVFAMAFAGIGTCVLLKIVELFCGLRISEDEESLGLDLIQHGESACND